MNEEKQKLWRWLMVLAACCYVWIIFCLYMGVDWVLAILLSVFGGVMTSIWLKITVYEIRRFDVRKFVNGCKRRWLGLKHCSIVVVHSKAYMAGIITLILMFGHLAYLWLHDNDTEMRWCNGKGNLYVVHEYDVPHWVHDAKWGEVCIEQCKFCTFQRMHLIEYWYPTGDIEIANVYVVKSRFSDSFDVFYHEWYDKNKPERPFREIDESEIVKMKHPFTE